MFEETRMFISLLQWQLVEDAFPLEIRSKYVLLHKKSILLDNRLLLGKCSQVKSN